VRNYEPDSSIKIPELFLNTAAPPSPTINSRRRISYLLQPHNLRGTEGLVEKAAGVRPLDHNEFRTSLLAQLEHAAKRSGVVESHETPALLGRQQRLGNRCGGAAARRSRRLELLRGQTDTLGHDGVVAGSPAVPPRPRLSRSSIPQRVHTMRGPKDALAL
jgi:hypothetical protein